MHFVYSQDTIFLNGAVIWHYICLILFYNPAKIITDDEDHKPGTALLFLFLHPSTLPVHVCADVCMYVCCMYTLTRLYLTTHHQHRYGYSAFFHIKLKHRGYLPKITELLRGRAKIQTQAM